MCCLHSGKDKLHCLWNIISFSRAFTKPIPPLTLEHTSHSAPNLFPDKPIACTVVSDVIPTAGRDVTSCRQPSVSNRRPRNGCWVDRSWPMAVVIEHQRLQSCEPSPPLKMETWCHASSVNGVVILIFICGRSNYRCLFRWFASPGTSQPVMIMSM